MNNNDENDGILGQRSKGAKTYGLHSHFCTIGLTHFTRSDWTVNRNNPLLSVAAIGCIYNFITIRDVKNLFLECSHDKKMIYCD